MPLLCFSPCGAGSRLLPIGARFRGRSCFFIRSGPEKHRQFVVGDPLFRLIAFRGPAMQAQSAYLAHATNYLLTSLRKISGVIEKLSAAVASMKPMYNSLLISRGLPSQK